jgi:hypothetical protein
MMIVFQPPVLRKNLRSFDAVKRLAIIMYHPEAGFGAKRIPGG